MHWLAVLWISSGTMTVLSEMTLASWLNQANTVILTLGGSLILLYQRKLAADRAQARAEDKLVSEIAFVEVKSRLDAVVAQRDHEQRRADQLFEQLAHLTEQFEKHRCVFPLADGTARCAGKEFPPS